MRALVLGAGPSGLLHALSLRAHGVDVDAVFDPDRERARSLADMVRARVVVDADDLARHDAEVVAICGPPPVHVAQAVALARRERVVFVEKPIALDDGELDVLEAVEGVVPVLQWRFGRALRAVRRAMQWGELGPRPTIALDLAWRRDAAYFASGKGSRAQWGCGALLSIGIHAVDAALYAAGGVVESAQGVLARREGVEVEVGASLVMTTTLGAQITMRMTLDAACDRTRLSFCGDGVTAVIEGTEEDPTASDVRWWAADPHKLARLRELEREEPGFTAGPLLVPFVGAALGRLRAPTSGRGPEELVPPSVRGVAPAHRAIYEVMRSAARARDRSDSKLAVEGGAGRRHG